MMADANLSKTLIDLYSLALRLEAEGQYNLAKISRATAESMARKAAWELSLPTDRESLIRDIEKLLPFLHKKELKDVFQGGIKILETGGLPLLEDAPHPFVCRTCGFISIGDSPIKCPDCGAWGSSFQRFSPIYWLDAFQPVDSLDKLRTTPEIVKNFIGNLGSEELTRLADDGGWSIHQVISHLSDAQGVISSRTVQFLNEENPILESKPVFAWATNQNNRPPTTLQILDQYFGSRNEMVNRLEAVQPREWARKGFHNEFGDVTLAQQVSYFAAHEITHLPQIERLISRNFSNRKDIA